MESVCYHLTVFNIFFNRKIKNLEIPTDNHAVIDILQRKHPVPKASRMFKRYQTTFKIKGKLNTSLTLIFYLLLSKVESNQKVLIL